MTTPDWTTLINGISGSVLLPGDAGYSGYSGAWNSRTGLSKNPLAVTLPSTENDISTIIRFCYDRGLTLIPRSGGHSFVGASNTEGVLLDLRGYTGVSLISPTEVSVKSGTKMGSVYWALYTSGYTLTLPTVLAGNDVVGVGMALGGGHGLHTSEYETLSQRIRKARMVLYDGSIVECDNYENPDLLWALRGGGGGAFGIISELVFEPHPFERHSAISIKFDSINLPAGLSAWQTFCRNIGNTLSAQANITWPTSLSRLQSYASGGTGLELNVRLIAKSPVTNASLQSMANSYGLFPDGSTYGITFFAEFPTGVPTSGPYTVPPQNIFNFGLMPKNNFGISGSNIILEKTRQFCQGILGTGLYSGLSGSFPVNFGASFILMLGYGGNIRDDNTNSSSFPHKNALNSCQFLMSWSEANKSREPTFIQFMRDTFEEISEENGYNGYCNYPLGYLQPDGPTGYGKLYWGDNLESLQKVKKAYDPDNFINSPHSVPPLS